MIRPKVFFNNIYGMVDYEVCGETALAYVDRITHNLELTPIIEDELQRVVKDYIAKRVKEELAKRKAEGGLL